MLTTKKLLGFGVRHASTWQVFGSPVLERRAFIVKKFNPLERAYYDMLSQVEDECSLLSDFELRDRQEKKSRDKKKEGVGLVKIELAEDLLTRWKAEAVQIKSKLAYTPVTDSKDPERYLDRPITLLVKQKLGQHCVWLFPRAAHEGEETLRDTALRALSESVGQDLQVLPLGNAPIAYYHYKYPKDVKQATGFDGAKIFFFKVQYSKGQIVPNSKVVDDFMWANYDELVQNVPKPMWQAVKPAIYSNPPIDITPFLDEVDTKAEIERMSAVAKGS